VFRQEKLQSEFFSLVAPFWISHCRLQSNSIAHFIMCAGGSSLRKHSHRTLGPKWETLEIAGTP
jgi:hypothetical protein